VSNVYQGPWQFMAQQQGNVVSWKAWQSSLYGQDAGSVINQGGP